MKKLFILFVLLFNVVNIKAYENKYFDIDIPQEYKITVEENNLYKWEKDNKYISISISNNENGYTVKNYTEEDINNQKIYIEDKINENLDKYDTKVEVTDIKKIVLNNNLYSLSYTIYWPTQDHTGYDIYQFGNVISTDNYMYTIVYNSNTKEIDKEFNNILNSFNPIDSTNNQDKNNNYLYLIIASIFVFAFIKIIIKIVNKKKTSN